jgi:hypothetical protein
LISTLRVIEGKFRMTISGIKTWQHGVGPDISDAARHEGSEGTGTVHLLRGERAFI